MLAILGITVLFTAIVFGVIFFVFWWSSGNDYIDN